MLFNYKGIYNGTIVEKLKANGAIIIGKTNMDEFAMGSSTESSYVKETSNPWDTTRIPGGSSGGAAASIAASQSIISLGSDTGGSIRQPASLCGIVGLKPTYGRVSRFGLMAFASSLDQIGPLTKDVRDAALTLNVIAGYDGKDSTSVDIEVPDYTKNLDGNIKGMKIGVPKEYFVDGMEEGVKKVIQDTIDKYKELGAEIVDISLPHTKGTYVLSSGYYDAYYKKAQQVRRLIKEDFDKAFENVDVILTPTSPSVAFKKGEKTEDPIQMYLSDIFTISANLAGIPGLTVPAGLSEGLPVGLQLLGKAFDEETILKAGYAFEKARGEFKLPEVK
ncbi:MAG: hypothetical protein B6I28_06000 [Fusobacteriia bacterium 4572_132]|nr:MAG: hypothetical protein B6I28_06000 [Fusobacteriia bacterium 4572_132]